MRLFLLSQKPHQRMGILLFEQFGGMAISFPAVCTGYSMRSASLGRDGVAEACISEPRSWRSM